MGQPLGDQETSFTANVADNSKRFIVENVSHLGDRLIYSDNTTVREARDSDIPDDTYVIRDNKKRGEIDEDGEIEDLIKYIKITRIPYDFIPITISWLMSATGDEICPILLLQGSASSGKTETQKALTRLIDDSAITSGAPKDIAEALNNSYIRSYDNVNEIDAKTSDMLCGSVTGMEQEKRKLYSDTDIVSMDLRTALIMSTTNKYMFIKPELVTRICTIDIPVIPDDERIDSPSKIEKELEALAPKARGGLLKIISQAINEPSPDNVTNRLGEFSNNIHKVDSILGFKGSHDLFTASQEKKKLQSMPELLVTLIEHKDELYRGTNKRNQQHAWRAGELINWCKKIIAKEGDENAKLGVHPRNVIPLLEEYTDELHYLGLDFESVSKPQCKKILFTPCEDYDGSDDSFRN